MRLPISCMCQLLTARYQNNTFSSGPQLQSYQTVHKTARYTSFGNSGRASPRTESVTFFHRERNKKKPRAKINRYITTAQCLWITFYRRTILNRYRPTFPFLKNSKTKRGGVQILLLLGEGSNGKRMTTLSCTTAARAALPITQRSSSVSIFFYPIVHKTVDTFLKLLPHFISPQLKTKARTCHPHPRDIKCVRACVRVPPNGCERNTDTDTRIEREREKTETLLYFCAPTFPMPRRGAHELVPGQAHGPIWYGRDRRWLNATHQEHTTSTRFLVKFFLVKLVQTW